jgi:hypothetical protein
MQGGLVSVVSALGLVIAFLQRDLRWAFGSTLRLLNGPYTVLYLLPINRLLERMFITEDIGPAL